MQGGDIDKDWKAVVRPREVAIMFDGKKFEIDF
jgi:hypothetical protein